MNIREAKYYKHQNMIAGIELTLNDDSVHYVPRRNGNRHYAAILAWAEEDGNEIQAAE
jgi:hypothetical protein